MGAGGSYEWRTEKLAKRHVRSEFACGHSELDNYIRATASQDSRRDAAQVFVAVDGSDPFVAGYYALSAYSVSLDHLPKKLQEKLPRYPIVPATLLGRLAVTADRQGIGLGTYLLMDALRRALHAAEQIGSAAVVVHAIDNAAIAFYVRYDFMKLPQTPRSLFLPMTTIRQLGL